MEVHCVVTTPLLVGVVPLGGACPPELGRVGTAQWKAENPGLEVRGTECVLATICRICTSKSPSTELSFRE